MKFAWSGGVMVGFGVGNRCMGRCFRLCGGRWCMGRCFGLSGWRWCMERYFGLCGLRMGKCFGLCGWLWCMVRYFGLCGLQRVIKRKEWGMGGYFGLRWYLGGQRDFFGIYGVILERYISWQFILSVISSSRYIKIIQSTINVINLFLKRICGFMCGRQLWSTLAL